MRWLLTLAVLIVSGSNAFAAITLCNEFEHPVRFALAFPTEDGWVSEGWIKVDPKSCQTDTKHTDLAEFYWYGETGWINVGGGKKTKWSWGKQREFSVKDTSFTLTNADKKSKGARLVQFIGPVTVKVPSAQQVTLTIVDAKGTMTSISRPPSPPSASSEQPTQPPPPVAGEAPPSQAEAPALAAAACGNGKLIFEDKFATLDPSWGFGEDDPSRTNGPDGLVYKLDPNLSFNRLNQSELYDDYEVCAVYATKVPGNADTYVGVYFLGSDYDNFYQADIFPA